MRAVRAVLVKRAEGVLMYWVERDTWTADRRLAYVFHTFDEAAVRAEQRGGQPVRA